MRNIYNFKDKNVLVTGASSGIGRAIAVDFAAEGANVGINYYSSEEGAKKTLNEVNNKNKVGKHIIIQANVGNNTDVKDMFRRFEETVGSIDILVNNAGILIKDESHQMSEEEFTKVIDVNLNGVYYCSKQALKSFISNDKKGNIVNISSVHQLIPKPKYVGYSASKGGVENITKTLALEYANKGIRVNGIGPGAIATAMNKEWYEDEQKRKNVESHIPMRYTGQPEEISQVALFLASEKASYITGQTLFVDGGLTLFPDFENDWSSQR